MRDYKLEVVHSPSQSTEDQPKTVVHPKTFFREPGEDIEKWIRGFERVAKANNWSRKRQCENLPAFLCDRAAKFFDELPDDSTSDWKTLKETLKNHVLPKEARCLYYVDLYNRKQGIAESADDFGRDIQQLVCQAYTEMPVEHQDMLMCEHFVDGLRPELKCIMLISDPKNFQQAMDLAKREEINEHITNGSAPWVRPSPSYPSNTVAASPVAPVNGDQKLNERIDHLKSVVEQLALSLAGKSFSKCLAVGFGSSGSSFESSWKVEEGYQELPIKYRKTEVPAQPCSMYGNKYDIGIYCYSNIETIELFKKTWKPDHNFSFPTTIESGKKEKVQHFLALKTSLACLF